MAIETAPTLTFLFTDIAGSTRLWESNPDSMRLALARHDALLRAVMQAHGGHVFKTVGDAFCVAFIRPENAFSAAVDGQLALETESWEGIEPLTVRMAIHSGDCERRNDDYFGQALSVPARLLGLVHGGQILASQAAVDLAAGALPPQIELEDLGEHALRDLSGLYRIHQVCAAGIPSVFPPLRTAGYRPNNLPRQLTSFIGREREQAEVIDLLARGRLVTITGAGGAGKTRLAIEVAARVLTDYRDGVWIVELAPLSDPALVPHAAAEALGVQEQPSQPVLQTLQEFVGRRSLLLILDNCEHLIGACAELADNLLRRAPESRILVTSREALGISGETKWRLPSLALPDPALPTTPESLLQFESVQLLQDRATTYDTGFRLTPSNAAAAAQVCCRLDGIPLAIELAAARLRSLPLEQIADRLDDRFRLLTGGSRTALRRQQTLRALIDWSYDMLTAEERDVFHRLAVFAGGWRLESAEAVCADDRIDSWDVLDLQQALIDKSLVTFDESGEAPRYRLLESVRQYALEKLRESGEQNAVYDRHSVHMLEQAQRWSVTLESSEDAGASMRGMTREIDNLRAGMDWAMTSCRDARVAAYGQALARFFLARGLYSEGDRRMAAAADSAARIGALANLAQLQLQRGRIAWLRADLPEARRLYTQAYNISRDLEDRPRMVPALLNIAAISWAESDFRALSRQYREALDLARETGQTRYEALLLGNLGMLASDRGDFEEAQRYLDASIELHREIHNVKGYSEALMHRADVLRRQGRFAESAAVLEESRIRFAELGLEHERALVLIRLAEVLTDSGQAEEAIHHLTEGLEVAREIGDPWCEIAGLVVQGRIAGAEGDVAGACDLFKQSVTIAEGHEAGGRKQTAEILKHAGMVFELNDHRVAAFRTLLAAHREFESLDLYDRHDVARRLDGLRASLSPDEVAGAEAASYAEDPRLLLDLISDQ
jgi:predicted ATPase/class 3 adenylate cyclase